MPESRVNEVSEAVVACWGAGGIGDISTAAEDERRGWKPTEMTHDGDDQWHTSGTTVFDENARWGGPAVGEPDGDEQHEQGHIRARAEQCPMKRTGTDLRGRRAEWRPHFACCTG